jgi:hypothetical protein
MDYSNLLKAAAGIATTRAVATAVNDDHNHLVATIMEALGPRGRGFVVVRGVPQFQELRDKLLPLAKEIALMSEAQLPSYLKVSMFWQPRYHTLLGITLCQCGILFLEGNSYLEFLEYAIREPGNSFSTFFACTV